MRRNTEAALDVFRDLGATVEEVDLGWREDMLDAAMVYLDHVFGGALAPMLPEHGDKMTGYCRSLCEKGSAHTAEEYVASLEVAAEMYQTLGPILEQYNVLVCPTNATTDVPADFDQSTDKVTINGRDVNPFLGWVMTTPFNTLSRCPVISVPSGFSSNGVPTGLQIVGRTYCDGDVFQAALAYETALGGWFGSTASRPLLHRS